MIHFFAARSAAPQSLPLIAFAKVKPITSQWNARHAAASQVGYALVGVSARTLERRFVIETGLSFGRWRQQHDLLRALEQLAVGAPIKVTAASAGYASPSAFIAAFRKFFGTTPGHYFGVRSRSN